MEPGMNSPATQRGELRYLSDMIQGTMQRSKTKENVKIGKSDIQRTNIANRQD